MRTWVRPRRRPNSLLLLHRRGYLAMRRALAFVKDLQLARARSRLREWLGHRRRDSHCRSRHSTCKLSCRPGSLHPASAGETHISRLLRSRLLPRELVQLVGSCLLEAIPSRRRTLLSLAGRIRTVTQHLRCPGRRLGTAHRPTPTAQTGETHGGRLCRPWRRTARVPRSSSGYARIRRVRALSANVSTVTSLREATAAP